MASGIDKYFQIARCFRNETGRKDRQLEFSQLDLELAYVTNISVWVFWSYNKQQITSVVESILKQTLQQSQIHNPIEFREMEFTEAMMQFGSDKPDLRIPEKLHHIQSEEGQKIVYSLEYWVN